jgi:hypothetical protein
MSQFEDALELSAIVCDDHAKFLREEAHAGGDFNYLIARCREANYLASQIRRMKPPYPFCRTPEKCAGNGYCKSDPACNN